MRVLLHGCNGRMGQVLSRLISGMDDAKVVCGVDSNIDKIINSYPVYPSLSEVKEEVDVLIDFSNHSCLDSILKFGLDRKVPLIICTTGFSPEEKQKMVESSKHIPILNSANMSLGVNLIISLVKQAAAVLYKDFDIEIVEKHHNQKLDSPSGTALSIADAINSSLDNKFEYKYGRYGKTEKRTKNEIGIHAVRGGAIVGEHDVIFAGGGEIVEISHSALSRDVFGYGAIRAAQFIIGKAPGFYSMKDVIEE
ncbi:dihydrodipicolinate reductase [Caloramator quimbayensis]|uniref:4-hydroxy-tetrahydrodipicolinate reductase n=1 Tax=Caloramator quimbayensis TaxID=1147123 RepID=A0A1T4XI60_9CLOT|nr:4-hydroxy-tetrahydrodipicolinate reductase [Caloramator quimbayensis]SKA89166.1 dihydrodipicolinate reductase [Caloramator quimbayensis]